MHKSGDPPAERAVADILSSAGSAAEDALDAAERAMADLAGPLARLRSEAHPDSGRVALGFLHTLGGEAVPRLLPSATSP